MSSLFVTRSIAVLALCAAAAPVLRASGEPDTTPTASGGTILASAYDALQWRSIGPYRGGRNLQLHEQHGRCAQRGSAQVGRA